MRKLIITFLLTSLIQVSLGQKAAYVEYTIMPKNSIGNQRQLIAYFHNGNSLNERIYNSLNFSTVDLILKDNPNMSYRISDRKTYLEIQDPQLDKYKIQILRNEKIYHLDCSVIKVATHDTNNYDITIWITDDIMDKEIFMAGSVNSIDYRKLDLALKKNNLSGVPIIIQYEPDNSYQYVVRSFGYKEVDLSLFSLDGYVKQKPKTIDELYKDNLINDNQMTAMKSEELNIKKKYR